jgi:predicted nucleotide-binding protein
MSKALNLLSKDKPTPAEASKKAVTFPKSTLKEALRLAQAIQDNNAGDPYNRLDLAQAVGHSPESSSFRTLITSSNRYGLTEGSYAAEKISLTDLGRSIVAPRSDQERNSALLDALKHIEVFSKFFARFDQNKLPREDLLENTLVRDFDVRREDAKGCLEILRQNITDWGIEVEVDGNSWLRLDKLASATLKEPIPQKEPEQEEEGVTPTAGVTPKVFISHSKNAKVLEQMKTLLEFGQFEYLVAEEVETTSIPIPEKIFGLMRECNSAIINISADENEKDPDGSYRVNPNVLIEIGAAFLAYNRRVVLLTDKRVKLPSNLQGLYRCEYEGDELSFTTAMKLQKELVQFRTIT